MISNYYLPGLNGDIKESDKSKELSFNLDEALSPMSYLFYNDTGAFYRKYCDHFDIFKIREKRFLDFETPNRALITHEYDIQIKGDFDYSKFYYLFNPIKRLSWLKISQEGKRLSVAKESQVKTIVKDILITELSHLGDSDEIFNEMWQKKKGLPCFIKLEKKAEYNDFLLTASYYDSIKAEKVQNILCKIFNHIFSYFSPLLERRIKYEYFPLQEKSSWLYIKSPNNFNVRYYSDGSFWDEDINRIDFANSNGEEADPGKLSLTIINSKSINTKKDTVTLFFDIIVPKSLKVWFTGIYYVSIGALLITSFNVLNSIYLSFLKPIYYSNPIGQLFSNKNIGGLILSIIAAIIATRGWLISEETIFRKYSLRITYIMIFTILLYIAGMIL